MEPGAGQKAQAKTKDATLGYFKVISGQLAEMARSHDLKVLAHLFEMAEYEASGSGAIDDSTRRIQSIKFWGTIDNGVRR